MPELERERFQVRASGTSDWHEIEAIDAGHAAEIFAQHHVTVSPRDVITKDDYDDERRFNVSRGYRYWADETEQPL